MSLRFHFRYKLILFGALTSSTLFGQSDYEATLATKIVSESINVKQGEFVAIFGNSASSSLANSIATECSKTNAFPVILFTNDSLEYMRLTDSLKFGPKYIDRITSIMKQCRVIIVLSPYLNNPILMRQRLTTGSVSNLSTYDEEISKMTSAPGVRAIYVNHPLRSISNHLGLNFEEYESMVQKSNLIDNNLVMQNVNRLNGLLTNAKKIRIYNSAGTNIIFSIENQKIAINDGKISPQEAQKTTASERKISLPAGRLDLSVKEASGIGRIVIPEMECNYDKVSDVTLIVKGGRIEQIESTNSCLANLTKAAPSTRMIQSISFQFNWELKLVDINGLRFWRKDGGGLIWLTIGNSKTSFSSSKSESQFSFPLTGATVEIDDKVALKTGY